MKTLANNLINPSIHPFIHPFIHSSIHPFIIFLYILHKKNFVFFVFLYFLYFVFFLYFCVLVCGRAVHHSRRGDSLLGGQTSEAV